MGLSPFAWTWWLLLLGAVGYLLIPTVVNRWRCARRVANESQRRVALTFDDGPDPVWTPAILEILSRTGVQACFFMLGERAQAHPDLVRQVMAAGHEVGVHGHGHALPLLQGPVATKWEIGQTVQILTAITGKKPRLYRPPWGVFNPWTAAAAQREGLMSVCWSRHVGEWSRSASVANLCKRAADAHPGMILLLHDHAGPGARPDAAALVAEALPLMIAQLSNRGYQFVTLSELLVSSGEEHLRWET